MPGGCPGGMLKLRFDWYIIGMYRPPGLLKATWERKIDNILLRSTQRYESILLIGDLNCDLSRPDKGAVKMAKLLWI